MPKRKAEVANEPPKKKIRLDLKEGQRKNWKHSEEDKKLFREPSSYHYDEERKLRFATVWNNGKEENFEKLIDLKSVFTYCLPKMGAEYIVRHVMDVNHRLIACQKEVDGVWTTIGGICVRPFFYQRFGEVVFLAVKNNYQNKRMGRAIMRVMKEWMKQQGICYFLTYADNHAIGFFEKLGFSKSITMPKSQYDKYIKHYTGSELMECRVYEGVNYFKITENIQRQVHYVVDHIEKIRKKERKTPKKFPGLDKWKQSLKHILQKPVLDLSAQIQEDYLEKFQKKNWHFVRDLERLFRKPNGNKQFDSVVKDETHRKLIRELVAEPRTGGNYPQDFSTFDGLLEAGYVPPTNVSLLDRDPLTREMNDILVKLSNHKDAWPFRNPVDDNIAPNYYDVIKKPMDLHTMKENLTSGVYEDFASFKSDFKQIVQNCKEYNGEGNTYTNCVRKLDKYFDTLTPYRS